MDSATAIALVTLVLGAVLGGAVQAVVAWQDRGREARAAALLVGNALGDALERTHEPHLHPVRPVVIAFESYVQVWESERKALARILPAEDYAGISVAFAKLHKIKRDEEIGSDLREQVFDGLLDAGRACEMARRIAWKYAQSPRAKAGRWIRGHRNEYETRRGHRKVAREVRRIRRTRPPDA